MTAPDDALAAIEAHGVQSADDALAMADAILDPENDGVEWLMQHGCDVMDHLRAEVRSLRAHVASEPERTAAAVAGERARARRCAIYSARFDGCSMIDALQAARGMIENGEDDEVCEHCHDTGVNAASSKPCRCCEWARVLAADAIAALTGGGE